MADKRTNNHLKQRQLREKQEFNNLKFRLKEAAQSGSKEMNELHQETQSRIQQAQLQKPEAQTIETKTDTNKPYQNHRGEWILPSVEEAIKKNPTGESFTDIFNKNNS